MGKTEDILILTNNGLLAEGERDNISYKDCELKNLLYSARNYLNKGHNLLTDPQPPNFNLFYSPVRSLIFTEDKQNISAVNLGLMEEKISNYLARLEEIKLDYNRVLEYERVDKWLLESAIAEIRKGGNKNELKIGQY
ncbi:MAG: GrdX family protein [Halanaerobiales bacterium]